MELANRWLIESGQYSVIPRDKSGRRNYAYLQEGYSKAICGYKN